MKKIALVVGHRSRSQGAYGNAGKSEWMYYNELSREIMDLEKVPGIELKVFYRKEQGSGYSQRMVNLHQDIDSWGADISISMHFNASSHVSANGHEVLYYEKSHKSGRYAKIMNDLYSKYLDNRDRGVKSKSKKDRGGGFLYRGMSNCILIEPFFASNQDQYMPGKEERKNLLTCFHEFFKAVS